MSAVSKPSEKCLMILTMTNDTMSSRRKRGRRLWTLSSFGMGLMEKRLATVDDIWLMSL